MICRVAVPRALSHNVLLFRWSYGFARRLCAAILWISKLFQTQVIACISAYNIARRKAAAQAFLSYSSNQKGATASKTKKQSTTTLVPLKTALFREQNSLPEPSSNLQFFQDQTPESKFHKTTPNYDHNQNRSNPSPPP